MKEHKVVEDHITRQDTEDDTSNDLNHKYRCHQCKVSFAKQGYLTNHYKTLSHCKGRKYNVHKENYLDPNRPFKCDICKESFTKKGILVVHYKSVSHLRKLEHMMKETGSVKTPLAEMVSSSVQDVTDNQEMSELKILMKNPNIEKIPIQGQQMLQKFTISRSILFKTLLEGFGFEVAMQFNESSQNISKREYKNVAQKQVESNSQNAGYSDEESSKPKIYLPKINRSFCKKCGISFSDILIFKLHQEEVHKEIVDIHTVEKFANEFREDYEKRKTVVDYVTNRTEARSEYSNGNMCTGISSSREIYSGATYLSARNAATHPTRSLASQMPDASFSGMANNTQKQIYFNQLLVARKLGMGLPKYMNMGVNMNLPLVAGMKMHPPLIPVKVPPSKNLVKESAFGHPITPEAAVRPKGSATQKKLLQVKQLSQQQKGTRTRLNDEQLKILQADLDINNSPTAEKLLEMSEKLRLPLKVIKVWYRNTLFKERQRNKNSPYNFTNPPSTYLNLEEYGKTPLSKIPVSIEEDSSPKMTENIVSNKELFHKKSEKIAELSDINMPEIKIEKNSTTESLKFEEKVQNKQSETEIQINSMTSVASDSSLLDCLLTSAAPCIQTSFASMTVDLKTSSSESSPCNLKSFATSSSMIPPNVSFFPTPVSPLSTGIPINTSEISCSSSKPAKRARTTFTDYQIQVLQEFLKTNAYPKNNDLEYLSKRLNLSPKVICIWFQNNRRKSRTMHSKRHPPSDKVTPANNPNEIYICDNCSSVFSSFESWNEHQKLHI